MLYMLEKLKMQMVSLISKWWGEPKRGIILRRKGLPVGSRNLKICKMKINF